MSCTSCIFNGGQRCSDVDPCGWRLSAAATTPGAHGAGPADRALEGAPHASTHLQTQARARGSALPHPQTDHHIPLLGRSVCRQEADDRQFAMTGRARRRTVGRPWPPREATCATAARADAARLRRRRRASPPLPPRAADGRSDGRLLSLPRAAPVQACRQGEGGQCARRRTVGLPAGARCGHGMACMHARAAAPRASERVSGRRCSVRRGADPTRFPSRTTGRGPPTRSALHQLAPAVAMA
eukprot:360861-Chlamydomonas_euryale.AAC.2